MTTRIRRINPELQLAAMRSPDRITNEEPQIIAKHKDFTRFAGLMSGMKKVIPSNIIESTDAPAGLRLIKGQKFIVNGDNGAILAMMGKDYATVSHLETVQAVMDRFAAEGIDPDKCPVIMTVKDHGLSINLRVVLNELMLTPSDGKSIYGCFEFANSLDGSSAVKGMFKLMRMICTNGMTFSRDVKAFKAVHSIGSVGDGTEIRDALANLSRGFADALPFYEKLIATDLNMERINDMLRVPVVINQNTGEIRQGQSKMAELIGPSFSEGVNSILTTGGWNGFTVPGINSNHKTLYDAYNTITGLAHGKFDPMARNKVEDAALDFVDAYNSDWKFIPSTLE